MISPSLLIRQIDTARLRIRKFTRGDIKLFISFMTDCESTAFLPFAQEQKTRQGAKQLIESTIESYSSAHPMLAFAVEEQMTRQLVGFCGLNPHDEETIEIMYAVMPSARQQGYATEIATALARYSLNELGYRRVIALIVPANKYSKIVAARVGFKDGGLVRDVNFAEQVHQFILEQEPANTVVERA